jgi:hypothetical protein
MATHISRHVGHAPSLIRSNGLKIRPQRFATPPAESGGLAKSPAPQPYSSSALGIESARMSREMGREMPLNALQRQKSGNPVLGALMTMSTARFVVLLAGIALLVGGVVALHFPVFLPEFDQWGFQINCGTGIDSALTQADAAGANYVDRCHAAIAVRRDWTVPVTLAGAVLLAGLLVKGPRQPATAQA